MAHKGNRVAGTRKVIRTHGPPGTLCSPSTWSSELLGPGKGTKPSLCPCGVPKNLRGLDLESALNAGPASDSALAEHPGA